MVRSRLLFTILFLAYLGVTPVGVYTCACFMPAQAELAQVELGDVSEQPSSLNSTAVATLLSYFSMAYLVAAALLFLARRSFDYYYAFFWLEPYRFCQPPPTPPPHFA